MLNSENFWNESEGTWEIVSENSNFFRAIETALSFVKNEELDHVPNFNRVGTAFFIRHKDFCIRVAENWGQLDKCWWNLNKDKSDTYVVGKVFYKDLN